MNIRYITIFLVLGMTAALFLTHSHLLRLSPLPIAGSPAAAQTPAPTTIQIEALPKTGDNAFDPWQHFAITVPLTNPPLDMHTVFLVDGKGTEIVDEEPHAWSQPILFKYRLDSDDDSRVKAILAAQGLPVKENLITYHFAAGTNGWSAFDKTIRFLHGPGGNGESTGGPIEMSAKVGGKIILYSALISDKQFKGSLGGSAWMKPEYAPKTPPGMVHHLCVYILFQLHQGPPVKGRDFISRDL
jgi:hypothetical protein